MICVLTAAGVCFVCVVLPAVLQFRFMLLALASLEAPLQLPLGEQGLYGEDCVFIANDWHAALVPVYLAAKYRSHGVYTNARSVMAIHNLRHQVRGCGWVCFGGGAGKVWVRCTVGRDSVDPWARQTQQITACTTLCSRSLASARERKQSVVQAVFFLFHVCAVCRSAAALLLASCPFRLTQPSLSGMHCCRVCFLPPPSTASACPLDGTVSTT